MGLNQHVGHRGFFRQVSGLFFGKVSSTVAFNTPVRAAKALCGTVWQLLYIRAKIGSTRASNHDGVEVPALWFLERGGRADEEHGDDDWRHDIDQMNGHDGVVPCFAALVTPSGWSRHR